MGGCIIGGFDGNARRDQVEQYLCDYDTKEVYVAHCRTEDCKECREPIRNHYGYKHNKCRFGNRKIKCTKKPWNACEHVHSKHILPRHVCGDKAHSARMEAAHAARVDKHPERHQVHEDMNILTSMHIAHAEHYAHPHDGL